MEEPLERVQGLLASVANRCWEEPDLEDSSAGAVQHSSTGCRWCFAAVARRVAWAAQGETPLTTACPKPGSRTNQKWADGALIWPDGLGALITTDGRIERSGAAVRCQIITVDAAENDPLGDTRMGEAGGHE